MSQDECCAFCNELATAENTGALSGGFCCRATALDVPGSDATCTDAGPVGADGNNCGKQVDHVCDLALARCPDALCMQSDCVATLEALGGNVSVTYTDGDTAAGVPMATSLLLKAITDLSMCPMLDSYICPMASPAGGGTMTSSVAGG